MTIIHNYDEKKYTAVIIDNKRSRLRNKAFDLCCYWIGNPFSVIILRIFATCHLPEKPWILKETFI